METALSVDLACTGHKRALICIARGEWGRLYTPADPTRPLSDRSMRLSFCPNNLYSFVMYTILPEMDNPALREIAREIPISDIGSPRIQKLIAEMKNLLAKEEYGVALAAPQVGEPIRLFIVSGRAIARDSRNSPDEPEKNAESQLPTELDQIYINPVITKMSRMKKEKHEGCLSIRGKWGMVARAEKASVRAHDENGRQFTRGASGFLAHVFQHEMDHLEGILYRDKATRLYDEKDEGKK